MKSRILLSLAIVAGLATSSFADLAATSQSPTALNYPGVPPLDPTGSNFDGGVTVFNGTGGAFLLAANLNFPGGSIGLNPLYTTGEEGFLDVTANPTGSGQEKLLFTWSQQPAGSALIPAGATLGGAPITQIGFEIGSNNFGNNGLEWNGGAPFTLDSAVFELIGVAGNVIFSFDPLASNNVFINPNGSLGAGIFINAGGADLGGFGIAGGRLSVTITEAVPEPTSVAMLGLFGLGLVTRRRR